MFTILLISAPQKTIDPTLPENLRNAWGGGDVQWLCPDQAAEFNVPSAPDRFAEVWGDLQDMQIDMAIQDAQGRKKKILIADMDSTIIEQECIDELAAEAGVGAHVAAITAQAMNGDLDFEMALRARVETLKDLPLAVIEQVYKNRITFMAGAKTVVQTMRAKGAYAALVSGGFIDFTSRVAAALGFDEHRANTLLRRDGQLTGQVGIPILGRDAKVNALTEISARLGLTAADAIAVGDGANDLGMLNAAATGVALHAKPVVQQQAQIRINHCDLTALLYLQGYTRDEFR